MRVVRRMDEQHFSNLEANENATAFRCIKVNQDNFVRNRRFEVCKNYWKSLTGKCYFNLFIFYVVTSVWMNKGHLAQSTVNGSLFPVV